MKINYLSQIKILALLTLLFITLSSGGDSLQADDFKYLSGDVNMTGGIPGANSTVGDTIFYRFAYARCITGYTAEEIGSDIMYISKIAVYIDGFNGTVNPMLQNASIWYKFTPDDINISKISTSSSRDIAIASGWNCAGANPTPEENNAASWSNRGYTPIFNGNINWQSVTAGWYELELPVPHLYDGTENLYIVYVHDDGNHVPTTGIAPQLSMYNYEGEVGGRASIQTITVDAGAVNWGFVSKPILRLNTYAPPLLIDYATPNNYVEFPHGEILNDPTLYPGSAPSFSINMQHMPESEANLQTRVFYEIVGPVPYTNVVYTMTDDAGSNNYITITKNELDPALEGIYTKEVSRATGEIAWTQDIDNEDANNYSLDLRDVQPGQYRTRLKLKTQSNATGYSDTVFSEENYFYVRTDKDIEITSMAEPMNEMNVPTFSSTGVRMSVTITNSGTADISEFWARARVYEVNYNPQTGTCNRIGPAIAALPLATDGYHWVAQTMLGRPFRKGESILLNESQFTGGFTNLGVGWYDIEVEVWLDSSQKEVYTFNNIYPRPGTHRVFRAQSNYDPYLTSHRLSTGNITALGNTVEITTGLVNDGLLDIAHTSTIWLETTIYTTSGTGGVKGRAVYGPFKDTVTRGGANEGEVIIPCANTWYANESGKFLIETKLFWDEAPTGWVSQHGTVTTAFEVRPGLAGSYRIGAGQTFETINSVLNSLYSVGVSGDCVFELTDAEYNEFPTDLSRNDYPALDFRSKIPGMYEWRKNSSGEDVLVVYTIKFVPSASRATENRSIKVNLISNSGVGMWFGATSDIVSRSYAMVNTVPELEKRKWNQNDGFIAWDGGAKKSIEIIYKRPETSEAVPGDRFRAPIYMTSARNITIKNCVITDGNALPSYHYLLPGNTYNGPNLEWVDDYDWLSGVASNKTYSAGISIRALPPEQTEYQENRYHYDTLQCYNINISGNDISRFSYGVLDIGLNYKLSGLPFVIDIVDTLYNVSSTDLSNNANLIYRRTETLNNVPLGGNTSIRYYEVRNLEMPRGNRYYKHYVETLNGVSNGYVIVLDSANDGVKRSPNYNNLFENNIIHDIGRAGIVLGNEENSVISGNRIHGIHGQVVNENELRVDSDVDCAGILLGGLPRKLNTEDNLDGSMVFGVKIYKNEISEIFSMYSASGIALEQTVLTENITVNATVFPDCLERYKIYSNIIWGIRTGNVYANRYGLKLAVNRLQAENAFFETASDTYFMRDMLIANNTIIMDEDQLSSSQGDYYGLYLQKIKDTRVLNNAVEMEDSTHYYNNLLRKYCAAAVFYQGASPLESNNNIDYNVYSYRPELGVSAYRYVNTDNTSGKILDEGYADEYNSLINWQNWMQTDLYSNTKSFYGDLLKVQTLADKFEKLRFRTNPAPLNSPLDKRGVYLLEAETDIDGQNRTFADQRLDIGAQIVNGEKLANDVEVINILSPATYHSMRGPFSDAEYIMIEDKPIVVRALIRNNSNATISKTVTLRIVQESASVNNANTTIHNNNYANVYWGNELEHNMDVSSFRDIDLAQQSTYTSIWQGEQTVTIATGEGMYVDFQLDKTFSTYYHLPGYNVPIQFDRMRPNVTPRILFAVSTDHDMDIHNNFYSKYVRFYVKKSKRDILVSASNTFNTINIQGEPNIAITNPDMIAGRLNLDTIIAGFSRLNLYQTDAEAGEFDFDVLDRRAWDYRNVNYNLWRTVYISDELKIDTARWLSTENYDFTSRYFQDRWFMQNIRDFLSKGNGTYKNNLIIASEEHISDIYSSIKDNKFRFLESNMLIKNQLIDSFYRTNVAYDTVLDASNEIFSYSHKIPIWERRSQVVETPYSHTEWWLEPRSYVTNTSKPATISGVDAYNGFVFDIKPTGWEIEGGLKDIDPIGAVFKPIESIVGSQAVFAILDTMTLTTAEKTEYMNVSAMPHAKRIAAMFQNTMKNNIVFLGFDWRHFGNVDMLLAAVDHYLSRNGGQNDDPALPISFYGFDAYPVSNRVELSWNTTSETIVSKFELERANVVNEAISDFELINAIESNAHNTSYNTTDLNLAFGHQYAYRLKLIDSDGKFVYTPHKIVNIEEGSFSVQDIAPNPVTSVSTFTVISNAPQNVRIAIYNLAGKELLVLNDGVLGSGNFSFDINNTKLNPGTYTVSIDNGKETIIKTFTVIK